MSNFFWVIGTGTADNVTANWATVSGGPATAGPVTVADSVFFDANSGGGTATFDTNFTFAALDSTGYTGTLTVTNTILPHGNVTIGATVVDASGISLTYTSSTSIGTITTNGHLIGLINMDTDISASVTLGDDCVLSSGFSHSAGTLTTNNFILNISAYTRGGTGLATTLNLGTSTVTLRGTTGTLWNTNGAGAQTINAGTSTIKFVGGGANSVTFAGAGKTYGTVWFARGTGTGTNIITGANTFSELKDDGTAAHQITFPASTTQTITTWTITGNSGALISIRSSSAGTQATLSKSAGTVNANYLDIKDSAATGGATWNAGANSVDSLNNTGWIFGSVPSLAAWNDTSWMLIPRVLRQYPASEQAAYFGLLPASITYGFDNEPWNLVTRDYRRYLVDLQVAYFAPPFTPPAPVPVMFFPPWVSLPLVPLRNPMPEWTFQIGGILNPNPIPPRPSATVFAMTENVYLVRVIQNAGY